MSRFVPFIILLLGLGVFALAQHLDQKDKAAAAPARVQLLMNVERFDDKERDVTCYVLRNNAIACVGMNPGDDE